jgi:sugar/nucleoside kinase (ribokinase family)
LLPKLDLLFVSREEIELPGIDSDPAGALSTLAGGRLETIALKRGERGGHYFDARTGRAVAWPACAERADDPTGAGDAFAGGYLAGRLTGKGLAASLARGVVSASFAIQEWGAHGLLAATRDEANRRLDAWCGAFVE